jgi:hypothetical protein
VYNLIRHSEINSILNTTHMNSCILNLSLSSVGKLLFANGYQPQTMTTAVGWLRIGDLNGDIPPEAERMLESLAREGHALQIIAPIAPE